MKRNLIALRLTMLIAALWLLGQSSAGAQTYRPIDGFPEETNRRIESFLNSTLTVKERKVAVFDCDGTLLGQVPYYLSDEAMYDYAKTQYEGRRDEPSRKKWEICDRLIHGDNVGMLHTRLCIDFFSGLTPDELGNIGWRCFHEKFERKFYPEMKQLLANLEAYGFEIWIVTASTELLYQRFVHEELGIPVDRILGVKSCVRNGIVTDEVVTPIPQDAGKAEVIQTFIKARPMIAGGNSRGDMEMLLESTGLRIVVNPDPVRPEKAMGGKTVAAFWENDPQAVIVRCNDVPEGDIEWTTGAYGVGSNMEHPKN